MTDPCGASAQTNATVIVADTTPLVGSCPAAVNATANVNCQAAVPNLASQIVATDNGTPAQSLIITQNPAPGTVVGLGQHSVTVTVTECSGNSASVAVPLAVVSTSPPATRSVVAIPNVFSPPNHQLVPVTISALVSANCDPAPVTKIVSITSHQPASPCDIQITGNLTASLAASKSPTGDARFYTITVQSTDASGNSSTALVMVTVPKSNGSSGVVTTSLKRR